MAEVELKNVRKGFIDGKIIALQDIDLKIPEGMFTTVLGPSGCGKTTLLRIIAGLERSDAGEVLIGGRIVSDVPPRKRNIAMVFQNYALYPHKKVFENIAIGLRLRGYRELEIKKKVDEVSKMLKIEDLMARYPKQLSGGQQQRVALARALVRDPEVFLLDEPLSNLDAQVRDITRTELKRLFKDLHATVIYVTHDQTEAMMMSDFIVVMNNGMVRQTGEPISIYKDPDHRFVAEFLGTHRINLLHGRIEKAKFISDDGLIFFDTLIKNKGNVLAGIRPEYIVLEGIKEISLKGITVLMEPVGATNLISIRIGKNELKVLTTETPAIHEPVIFSFSLNDIYFFDAQSGLRLRTSPSPSDTV
jgi:multiple sugar transport system ATP-binding protein